MNNLLTVKQAAKLLGVHEITVRRWISQKKLKSEKIGGKIFVYLKPLGVSYKEKDADDSKLYGDLLNQNDKTIGVWGVGYIGFSTLVSFAVEGIKGIGYDVDKNRVRRINKGEVDIPGLREWLDVPIKNLIDHGLISATEDFQELFKAHPLVHFICIPTERKGEPWFEPLVDVVKKLADYLSNKKEGYIPLIIVESTLTPGTSDKVILKIFSEKGLKKGKDYYFAIAPRRDWFTEKAKTMKNIDRVYGCSDIVSAKQTESVLARVCGVLHQASDYRVAEMVKSVENAYRHMDITLANQLSMAYPEFNIREVLRLVGTKWNVGTFYPSFGTGGYCIPLSSKYVINGAAKPQALTLLKETIKTDLKMPKLVAKALLKAGVKSVGILGLSYKGNMKVPQQSPAIGIAYELTKRKVKVRINDPYFDRTEIKNITGCDTFSFPEDVSKFEGIVIVSDHAEYQSPSARRIFDNSNNCKVIYDNVGIWQNLTYFATKRIKYYIPGDAHWIT